MKHGEGRRQVTWDMLPSDGMASARDRVPDVPGRVLTQLPSALSTLAHPPPVMWHS